MGQRKEWVRCSSHRDPSDGLNASLLFTRSTMSRYMIPFMDSFAILTVRIVEKWKGYDKPGDNT